MMIFILLNVNGISITADSFRAHIRTRNEYQDKNVNREYFLNRFFTVQIYKYAGKIAIEIFKKIKRVK